MLFKMLVVDYDNTTLAALPASFPCRLHSVLNVAAQLAASLR